MRYTHTSHYNACKHLILDFVDLALDLGHLRASGINGGLDIECARLQGKRNTRESRSFMPAVLLFVVHNCSDNSRHGDMGMRL